MDQDLEKLYSPSHWSKRYGSSEDVLQSFYDFFSSKGGILEQSQEVTVKKNLRYGQGESTLLDIYSSTNPPTEGKLFVFIHGGFWQEGSKDCYGFFKPFVSRGYTVLVPGYDLAPEVDLKTIMEEMEQLYNFLDKYTSTNKIKETWICGHSVGAHLALALLKDLSSSSTANFISGLILISGVYDLQPVVSTSNNIKLGLSIEKAKELSPINWDRKEFLDRIKDLPIFLIVGQQESPAFIQQTMDMTKRLSNVGVKKVKSECLSDYDHFNIVTDLFDETSCITSTVLLALKQN